MTKMKAWVFHEKEKMVFTEIDVPAIGDGEVLVRVKAVGICGSDVSYYYGHSPVGTPTGKGPIVLGHEMSGVVEKAGKLAQRMLHEGDRVTLNPVQQCNACPACLDGRFNVCSFSDVLGVGENGGFAEFVKVRYSHALKIADSVSFEEAALTEPLACATYASKKLDVRLGDFVAVIGSGSIGLMMLQLAKARGAGKIAFIGTRDAPLEVGRELGADHLINVKDKSSRHYAADVKARIAELAGKRMADRAIVPTSAMPALQSALDITGPWATIVYFGLPGPGDMIQVPALECIQSDKTIRFAWLAPLAWPEALSALAHGKVKVDKLISHRYQLSEVEKGIKDMAAGKADKIKGAVIM